MISLAIRAVMAVLLAVTTAIFAGMSAPPAEAAGFLKGPWLVFKNDNTAMTVLWQTDAAPSSATIEWGPTPACGNGPSPVSPYGDLQFAYDIGGLTPGSLCYYRVVVDGKAATGSFRAAPPAGAGRVVLYGYGDSRTFPYVQNKVLRRLLEDVTIARDRRQTLSLHAGDLVTDGLEETDWQDQHFNRSYPWTTRFQSQFPLMITRGSHEFTGEIFRKYYPYATVDPALFYQSFDYGPVHVTIVDDLADRDPGSAQYQWIDDDLAASSKPWKIALFHQPAWGAGGGHENNATNQMLTSDIFEPRGVALAFTGHNHYYARNEKSGITHVTSGGGGAPNYDADPSYPYYITSSRSFHFTRMSFKNETLHFTAFDWSGRVIDNFFIRRGPDLDAPAVDAVRAAEDGRTVKVIFDECVESGGGPNGAENPGNYQMPGFTVMGAVLEDARDTVRLSVLPAMQPGQTYELTTHTLNDCATPPNIMSAADSRSFAFDEGPGVVVEQGDTWKYFRGVSDPGPDWYSPGHDDTGWEEGPTGIGYGGRDDATALDEMSFLYTTVFLRRTFDVCDALAARAMTLTVDYDDGFAAYVNGVRVAGRNDADFTGHNFRAVASAHHEAGTRETIDISHATGALRGGGNVLAIVLLNAALNDPGATMIPEMELTGGYCTDTALPPETATGDPETGPLVWLDRETLTWPVSPRATAGYRLYRGVAADLSGLANTGTDSCLRLAAAHNDETTASGLTDDPAGVPGRMYWYLVTGVNSFGEGTAGTGASGPRILNSKGDCALP